MHYKHGRAAKPGDKVIHLPSGQAGLLHSTNAQATTCNGRMAPIRSDDPYVTLSDCLHVEDIAAATIPDATVTPG